MKPATTIARPGRRVQIKTRLRDWIRRDNLRPGDRLLPQRELAALLETSEVTAHRVLNELADAGEVYRVRGQGTFVGPRPGARELNGVVSLVLPGKDLDRPERNPEYWPIVQSIMRAFMGASGTQRPFQIYPVTEADDLEDAARHLEASGAVFFHYRQQPRELIDLLIARGRVPVVCLGKPHPDMPCLTLDHDRAAGAHRAASYLLRQGYRRVGLVASRLPYGELMVNGYRTALEEADLSVETTSIARCGESRHDAAEAAAELLQRATCDAIMVDADMRAMGVYDELCRHGIAVPEEMALMGYEGLDFTRFHPPYLTSIEIPWAELLAAARREIETLQSPQTPHKHIELIGRVVPGQTTGKRPH